MSSHNLVRLVTLTLVALVLVAPSLPAGPPPQPAVSATPAAQPSLIPQTKSSIVMGIGMVVLLLSAFVAMTRYNVPLPLAMSLVACAFLGLQWGQAGLILQNGFEHYANIVVLFTAVAIPAHMIERSSGFKWIAAYLGYQLGRVRLRYPRLATPLLVFIVLLTTYVAAGLMHNVTSILIMTPIIIRLCVSYGIPSRWVLCGALVASNLGGFSTRWGDTPNILEADTWRLSADDFMREVVPANLIVLGTLMAVVVFLTQRTLLRQRFAQAGPSWSGGGAPRPDSLSRDHATPAGSASAKESGPTMKIVDAVVGWKWARQDLVVDVRLLLLGLSTLTAFIVLHVVFDEYKIAIGALTILVALALERSEDRFDTLKSLGFDVYLAFAAIFVLAGCVKYSWIGMVLQDSLQTAGASPWMISLTGYFGTMFTEAASWAAAVSRDIYAFNPSHPAAWALGGGICAGSSSLVTAASAGIILAEESARFKDPAHEVTFRRYLPFGLGFSVFMLVFYSTYFTVMH